MAEEIKQLAHLSVSRGLESKPVLPWWRRLRPEIPWVLAFHSIYCFGSIQKINTDKDTRGELHSNAKKWLLGQMVVLKEGEAKRESKNRQTLRAPSNQCPNVS